jgi:hypothetical protein
MDDKPEDGSLGFDFIRVGPWMENRRAETHREKTLQSVSDWESELDRQVTRAKEAARHAKSPESAPFNLVINEGWCRLCGKLYPDGLPAYNCAPTLAYRPADAVAQIEQEQMRNNLLAEGLQPRGEADVLAGLYTGSPPLPRRKAFAADSRLNWGRLLALHRRMQEYAVRHDGEDDSLVAVLVLQSQRKDVLARCGKEVQEFNE